MKKEKKKRNGNSDKKGHLAPAHALISARLGPHARARLR